MAIGIIWGEIWDEAIWNTAIWAQTPGAPSDDVPDQFTFTDQVNVARSSTITSVAITVSGIDIASAISVVGGTYDINASGTFVSTPGTVNNGDTVRVRHTSSANYSSGVGTTLTIGGVSDTFISTTLSDPANADENIAQSPYSGIAQKMGFPLTSITRDL